MHYIWNCMLAGVSIHSISLKAAFWSLFSFYSTYSYTQYGSKEGLSEHSIGGIAGSTPPVIGWIVVPVNIPDNMNPFDLGRQFRGCFMLIFRTPPHFWALALYRSGEYGKVGISMLPGERSRRTLKESKSTAFCYCLAQFLVLARIGLPLHGLFPVSTLHSLSV